MPQKIEIVKNDFAKQHNRDYNAKIRSISDEIFQTRHIYPAGYIPVNLYREEHVKFSAYRDEDNNITRPSPKARMDEGWSSLSEYEVIIASHLLYGSYDTYIFSGGMGSGKTSTASHVLNFIRDKYTSPGSAFINIHFDFNLKVNDEDNFSNGAISRFVQQMYENLKLEIFNFIEGNERDVLKGFVVNLMRIRFREYADFFDFRKIVQALEWAGMKPTERAESFFYFVEKDNSHVRRVEKLMKFLRFLRDDLTDNEFIIIFYDNIDVLDPPLQHEIFAKYILPLNQIARCKCLISLRRTTFARNFDYTDVHFAHSFGFIHHHGHQTSDIVKDRLSFYVKHIDSEKIFKEIDPVYRQALKNRLAFLLQEFSASLGPHNLGPFLNALSGNSVRLGLYMANRLLINSVIRYDDNPSQRTYYKRALLVNDDTNLLMGDKEEIINLFSVAEHYSLLPLKILHDVNLAAKDKRRIRITDIMNDPVIARLHTEEEVEDTLKSLMYSRRPLLWMDKVLLTSNLNLESSLYMTEIGDGYIDNLIGELSYIQECFFVVRWPSEDIPLYVNMLSEEERLDTVLRCLRYVFDDEFDTWEDGVETDIDQKIVSLRIIERVGTAMMIIYSKNQRIMSLLFELISYMLDRRKIYYQPLYALLEDVKDHIS